MQPPHLRFYCGMPLVTPDGYALGTLCVVDFQPREISFEQGETVRRLARKVVTQLELRRRVLELDHALAELRESRTAITEAKLKSEELLLNIQPRAIAEELKQHGKVIPRHHVGKRKFTYDVGGGAVGFCACGRGGVPCSAVEDVRAEGDEPRLVRVAQILPNLEDVLERFQQCVVVVWRARHGAGLDER
jgi:hypothetical protein